jgi:hypothetical protein
MDGAAIPEQIHGAAQTAEEMLKEGPDVEAREIPGPTPLPGPPPALGQAVVHVVVCQQPEGVIGISLLSIDV